MYGDGNCYPKCGEGCINGQCNEPDKCTCNSGYAIDQHNKYKCNAICENECIHGNCIGPNLCECHPGIFKDFIVLWNNHYICSCIGYEFKFDSKHECLPVCDFCEGGNCTGPSQCTCWDNYEEVIEEHGNFCFEKIIYIFEMAQSSFNCTYIFSYRQSND